MTVPAGPLPIPPVVRRIARGRAVAPVWLNDLGGVTFRIGDEYVKTGSEPLTGEAERLTWARRWVTVPRVLGVGDGWLHTAALPGRSAVDPVWATRPAVAARAIGHGLRKLHDALPVEECPFGAPPWVEFWPAPEADRLVVCHGDACVPNTLMHDEGPLADSFAGHVDLGDLGIADRWADLAIATMSLGWNFTGFWEQELLEAYGVAPDPERIDHYRRLWDATDESDG